MGKRGSAKTLPGKGLRPFKGCGALREYGSNAEWALIEFLLYYDDHNKLKSVAYVRRQDGAEILDGEYEVVDELGERRRRWKKWDGKWQVKWRHPWNRQS
jgi:hypothetical protein